MTKIHNPDTYASLTDAQARDYCDDLAYRMMDTRRFKTELSRRTGTPKETIDAWFRAERRPPFLLVAYMQAEIERAEAVKTLLLAKEVNKRLEKL